MIKYFEIPNTVNYDLQQLKQEYKKDIPGLKLEDWGETENFSGPPSFVKEMSKEKNKKK